MEKKKGHLGMSALDSGDSKRDKHPPMPAFRSNSGKSPWPQSFYFKRIFTVHPRKSHTSAFKHQEYRTGD